MNALHVELARLERIRAVACGPTKGLDSQIATLRAQLDRREGVK